MKILRSVNRRGFDVGTAGWFTVLKPNSWFPATRLPRPLKWSGIPVKEIAGKDALNGADSPFSAAPMAVAETVENGHLLRAASIVCGALAITSAMLWWIMHP